MSKKAKIIVSISGIVLVMLILVGLTFAYFLTRINGNENDKSISVTTAYLALQYDDGNGLLSFSNLTPSNIIGEKTFTVTNVGNATVNNYVVVLEDLVNELERKDDLKLTITCETSNSNSPCLGVNYITFPSANGIILENSIKVLTTHTYKLKIEYLEPNVDQSIDMNKRIEGKIQVYDKRNVVDIYGVVNNATSTDYVELHSVPKVSVLNSENEYKFTGVLPGEHTIYVKDENGVVKGSRTIYINKGSEIDVDLDSLTITEDSGNINMDMTIDNGELELNVNSISTLPFSGSYNLNYNILYNSLNNLNGTTFSETPVSKPAEEISKTYTYKDDYVISDVTFGPIGVDVTQQEYYWTYAENITYNKSTGRFSLVNPQTCKYSECYEILKNKYVVSESTGGNSSATDTLKSYTNLIQVYKLDRVDAPDTTKTVYYTYYSITADADSAERTLSVAQDDYGTSYYYRGDVKDNYLEFNGYCWRIVRIEGDGAIKITLAATKTCSSITDSDTGTAFTGAGHYGYTQGKVTNSSGQQSTSGKYVADYVNGQTNNTRSMRYKLEAWLTSSGIDTSKLKEDNWCLGNTIDPYNYSGTLLTSTVNDLMYNDTTFYYDTYVRLYGKGQTANATLRCDGKNYKTHKSYIGALTADEVVFAGGKADTSNTNYYLTNNATSIWWTLSLRAFAAGYVNYAFCVNDGFVNGSYVYNHSNSLRPAVTLASGTVITGGNGTIENPYIIG